MSHLSALLLVVLFAADPGFVTAAPAPQVTPTGAPLAPARYLELRLRADSLWSARQRAEATPLYRQLVDAWAGDGDSRLRLAAGLLALGRREEAVTELEACLAAGFVDERQGTYQRAWIAAELGRTEEAMDWLDRALAARLEERPDLQTAEAFQALRANPRFRAQAGFLPEGIDDRVAGWTLDLDHFVSEAQRLHASPKRSVHGAPFLDAVALLRGRIAALDDAAMALELQKIVVTHLGDGHSVVYPMSTPHVDFGGTLPVQFYFFPEGVYLVGAPPDRPDLVGRRVVAIGGKPAAELLQGLEAFVSRDNEQGILMMGPLFLGIPAVLRALGATNSLASVTLTLEGNGGTEAVTLAAASSHPRRRLPPGLSGTPPRWLSRTETNYWQEPLPDLEGRYVQLNQVQNASEGATLAQWVEGLRREMTAEPARNLILDLRHNNGGNNFLIWPVVRLVAWHEMSDPANRTWVITGRGTFSACQNLTNFLDRVTNAVFVGEPSASRPNFTGEDTTVQLPWSGLRVSISSRYWQDSHPGDSRPYVSVSMPVVLSAADWRENRDPVLEALREFLNRARR